MDMLSVQGPVNSPLWAEKDPKAVFRGRDSRKERLELVRLARRNNTHLLDAGITAFFFFPKEEALMSERLSFFDFFKVTIYCTFYLLPFVDTDYSLTIAL